jgi:hypothetical protein
MQKKQRLTNTRQPSPLSYHPLCISIGQNVFHDKCSVHVYVNPDGASKIEIKLIYSTARRSHCTRNPTSLIRNNSEEQLIFLERDVSDIKFYKNNPKSEIFGGMMTDMSYDNDGGGMMMDALYDNDGNHLHTNQSRHDYCDFNFLAMGVKKTKENGLRIYSNSYQPASDNAMLKYVVLALDTEQELDDIIKVMKVSACLSALITPDSRSTSATEILKYCEAICNDRHRSNALSNFKSKCPENKHPDDVLFVYPFGSNSKFINDAAVGLKELSCVLEQYHKKNKVTMLLGKEFSCPLSVFYASTIEQLKPGIYLKDTLIDFWMRWIWRNSDKSNIHCFNTHFYTFLERDGPEGVTRWTEQRGVNIFTKKFIFLPMTAVEVEVRYWCWFSTCIVASSYYFSMFYLFL